MKFTCRSEGITSDDSTVGSGHTTSVVAKIVNIVLFSFLSKLGYPLLCVRSSGSLLAWRYTTLVSTIPIEHLIKLVGSILPVELWVLLSRDVECCSRLSD